MPDVAYDLAEIAAKQLGWQAQPVHRYLGGVEHRTWKPPAGRMKVKTGEFWPMIEALPSKFVMSLGKVRITIYVRGTRQTPIVDGVAILGYLSDPFREVFKAWEKGGYRSVASQVQERESWYQLNPEYRPSQPEKTPPKSKLNPDQLRV